MVINGDQMIKVCVLLVGNHLCGVLCGRAVCAAMVWLLQLQTLQQTRGDMYGAGTTWQGIVSFARDACGTPLGEQPSRVLQQAFSWCFWRGAECETQGNRMMQYAVRPTPTFSARWRKVCACAQVPCRGTMPQGGKAQAV